MILNTNIKSGENSFLKIQDYLKEYGYENPCVLVDENLYNNSNYVRKCIKNIFDEKRLIFYNHPFEPSYQMLDNMMDKLMTNQNIDNIDIIVGIGGGSAMDTAKGLAILSKNSGPSINYKGFPKQLNKPVPVIAVPSTTGTGSEVVYNASFIDEESKVKMGINYKYNYPILAILDPLVPLSAPMSVLASSGCDALVHSLESFMSIQTNEQVRFFAKRAYDLIMGNMLLILDGKGDLKNWENMQWAAVYAMFALSNSTSGPTGALSYYFGTNFKVNHGVAGGAFIGNICRYNHKNGYYDLSELYRGNGVESKSKEEKSALVVEEIEKLLRLANMPENLSSFGVNENNLEGFNRFAVQASAAMDYNPIKIDPNKVAELFITI